MTGADVTWKAAPMQERAEAGSWPAGERPGNQGVEDLWDLRDPQEQDPQEDPQGQNDAKRKNDEGLLLDLRLKPALEQVSAVRVFLETFLSPLVTNPDLLARMTIAAHELLENAAKYSAAPSARVRVGLQHFAHWCEAWVEVSNLGRPEHVDDLIMTVEELEDPTTAAEMYQIDMVCSALKGNESGLGLARIRAELEMQIDAEVSGQSVRLRATAVSEKA
jgi:anti-sigma regulatory factor (Ser/Thr protein kinase)